MTAWVDCIDDLGGGRWRLFSMDEKFTSEIFKARYNDIVAMELGRTDGKGI